MARRLMGARVARLAMLGVLGIAGVSAWAAGWFGDPSDSRVTGEILVGAGGRTLTASVLWTACEDRPRLVADESSDAVSLSIVRVRHAPADAICDGIQAEHMTVSLAAPLGHRRLESDGDTADLATFDEANLRQPAYLPPGYRRMPLSEEGEPVGGEHIPVPSSPTWQTAYAPNANYGAVLLVTQVRGKAGAGNGQPVTVDGRPARLAVERNPQGQAYRETLTWFDGTYTMTLVLQDFSLPASEILRVAQGLH
jgi:hypothetical protein